MNKNFQSYKNKSDSLLETRFDALARKWGLETEEQKTNDSRFVSAQVLARVILINGGLARLNLQKDPQSPKHNAALSNLTSQNFKPTFEGSRFKAGTQDYADVFATLKDLAHDIGTMVSSDIEDLKKARESHKKSRKTVAANNTEQPASRTFAEKLDAVKVALNAHISVLSGDKLSKFNETGVVPKIAKLKSEEAALKSAGTDNVQLANKQSVISLFEATKNFIENKLRDEPKTAGSQSTLPSKLATELEKLRTRVTGYIAAATGDNLVQLHDAKLLPKIAAIKDTITTLKATTNDAFQLLVATEHLAVLKSGAQEAMQKIATEASAKPVVKTAVAEVTPITVKRAANEFAYIPELTEVISLGAGSRTASINARNAFIGAAQQDSAFSKLMKKASTATHLTLVPPAKTIVEEVVSPRVMSRNTANAETVPFKEFGAVAPVEKKGPSLRERLASFGEKAKKGFEYVASGALVGGTIAGLGAIAIYAGLTLGFEYRDAQKQNDAMIKASASAKADFNKAQANFDDENPYLQPTLVVVTAPTHDKAKKAPVVERTLAEEEAFQDAQAAKIAKVAKVAKAETPKVQFASYRTTAKTAFAPVADVPNAPKAANDTTTTAEKPVSYKASEAKPFEISSFRMDVSTLSKACSTLTKIDPNGVCADFAQRRDPS